MKKILTVAIVLALVFALANSTSAAIAGTWTVAAEFNSAGTVEESSNAIVMNTQVNNSYDQSGIYYNTKVPVNNLTVVFSLADVNTTGYGAVGFISGIALSGAQFGDFVNYTETNNFMSGNTYGMSCDTAKTAAYCFSPKDASAANVFGGMSSLLPITYETWEALVSDYTADITVKFVVNGDNIDLYVNGTKAENYSVPKADVVDADGNAYLALFSYGFGAAGMTASFKTINGYAANEYAGQADYNSEVPSSSAPASSEAASEPASSISIVDSTPAQSTGCGNKA